MYQEMFAADNGGGGSSIYETTTLYKNGLQQGTVETKISASVTASDEGTYLKVRIENVTNKYAWLGIKADLTNVDYVTFYDVSVVTYGSNAQAVFAGPSLGTTTVPSGTIYQLTVGNGQPHKVMLDVTSLTGENYVGIYVWSGQAGGARETHCSLIELVRIAFPS